jgi:phage protein D
VADLNTLPARAAARQPRGAVKLYDAQGNGTIIPGWQSWEVDNNAYRSADTFRVVFIVSQLPDARGAAWFAAQTSIGVEILAGFPADPRNYSPGDLDSLIYGQADDVTYDPVQGTIEVSGRDLTAALIDTKTSEHFLNQTSSQIATALAQRHGLAPVVTATSAKAGDYYQIDHASTTQQQSEWELLTFLANAENFLLYVKGRELHFEPQPAGAAPYVIDWQPPGGDARAFPVSNAISLQLTRALHIAKGVTVEVRSWNAKQKKGFTAAWPRDVKAAKPGQSAAQAQVYRYTIPGLTPDAALARARALYAQIIKQEKRLTATLPADNLIDSAKAIQLRGTGTDYDQTYWPESIARSMSIDAGYRMTIQAKNTGPQLAQVGED